MKKINIHNDWGQIWYPTKEELFSCDINEFRDALYNKRLLIIKSVGELLPHEIFYIADKFGIPWNLPQYRYSGEIAEQYIHSNQPFVLTRFNNNIIRKIANTHMPWHSDIPNHPERPFPTRLLYMNKQPSNAYGKTRWLNIDLDILKLSEDELEYYSDCSVIQQNWLRPETEIQHLKFIKETPFVKGRKSLRLNYYVNSNDDTTRNAWIKKSFYKDTEINNEDLIGKNIKTLSQRQDILYEHTWAIGDMAIYDNWSFIHDRTALKLEPGEIRELIRLNIDHETNDQFEKREKFAL